MITLKDKVSLITGGSRGIGKAVSLLFARAGSNLVINYRADRDNAAQTRQAAEKYGARAIEVGADVADRAQVEAMINLTIREFGRIDILVTNAGIWKYNPIDGMSEELLRKTIDVNILGTFYPIMAAVPHMIKQKSGNIITISSTAGQRGEAFHSPYGASKGAIISLTKSLASELAPYNIRVNCVAPGWVDTDMSHEALEGEDRDNILRGIPMGRAASPDELAGPVLFMASALSSFMTGEIVNVNGGAVLCG
ncbi:MAG: SDR family oxidoreductase [Candidatus Zixiibacteriota bacterium]|nr:MAG: SDR family oxidoreductase [candidate division Zixibacteria bacterium]